MKRPKTGSTLKQYAYATRRLSPGNMSSKKEIALIVGYSKSMAENVKAKIEDTEGYQNAIGVLAAQSNNLLLGILAEFKSRGLKDFTNKDLNAALNAMTTAWDKIEKKRAPDQAKDPQKNLLRGVFTRRVETQTAVITAIPAAAPQSPSNDPMDF